jgi:hypothetical protein
MPISYLYIVLDETENLIIEAASITNIKEITMNLYNGKLVYFERFDSLIERKETIESWPEKKIKFLIDLVNPKWKDWKEEINKRLN